MASFGISTINVLNFSYSILGNWENKAARDGAVNRGLVFVEAFSKVLSELELVVHMYTLK